MASSPLLPTDPFRSQDLVHLNLAATKATDSALWEIGDKLPGLRTLNLFALKGITLEGSRECASKLVNLISLNLRGAGVPVFNWQIGEAIKNSCVNEDCEVLTGQEKWDSVY